MVKGGPERRLAPDEADDSAQDDRHPHQRGEALAEADAAEGGKTDEQEDAHGESHQHPH